MIIIDAEKPNPIHCLNYPGDDWLKHEGRGDPEKAFQGRKDYFDAAVWAAKTLAERLGPGWKGKVAYNLGWYYWVESPCGRLEVREGVYKGKRIERHSYSADLKLPAAPQHLSRYQFLGQGPTPHQAIRRAIDNANDALEILQATVRGL